LCDHEHGTAHTLLHAHTYVCAHKYAYAHTLNSSTHTHTHSHTYAHTRTHTHTHTCTHPGWKWPRAPAVATRFPTSSLATMCARLVMSNTSARTAMSSATSAIRSSARIGCVWWPTTCTAVHLWRRTCTATRCSSSPPRAQHLHSGQHKSHKRRSREKRWRPRKALCYSSAQCDPILCRRTPGWSCPSVQNTSWYAPFLITNSRSHAWAIFLYVDMQVQHLKRTQ
jgi:hypothetical protein